MIIDRKEKIKKAIAKTLLITQLFSPMGIKFTTKSYKNLANICTKTINGIVIDYTNPFKEFDYSTTPLLKEEDNIDEIEQLLKALDLNMNLSKEEKIHVENVKQFLKDNPYINLQSIYTLLGKLEIKVSPKLEDRINMLFYTGTIGENQKYISDSVIVINQNQMKHYNDYEYNSTFFHELVHITGRFTTDTKNGEIGRGLNEGMTSLIEYDYYPEQEDQTTYFFNRTCVKLIAEIIGEEKLLECYSKKDLTKVIMELEEKGIPSEKSVELIKNLDEFLKYYSTSYSFPFELQVNIINFFKDYLKQIEKKSYIDYYIYVSLINDLITFVNDPYSISNNSVKKFYYNSKAKEENKAPYYIEKVMHYEELEHLKRYYNLEVISEDFESKEEVKEVVVKVYLDETYGIERENLESKNVR